MNGKPKITIIILMLWNVFIASSQDAEMNNILGPKLLVEFLDQNDWQKINTKLKSKDWTFESTEDNNQKIIWAYKKNKYNDKAAAWCDAYLKNEKIVRIDYVTDEEVFRRLEGWFTTNGYKKIKTALQNESIITYYSNNKHVFQLQEKSQSKQGKDGNQFIVEVVLYGGIYDPLNGTKIEVFNNGNAEYNIVNGVINGEFKFIDSTNVLRINGYFKDGEKDGIWQNFGHDGKLVEKVTYKSLGTQSAKNNDLLKAFKTEGNKHGEYEIKYGEWVSHIGEFTNNLRSGEWKEIDNKGKLRSTKKFNSDGKTFYMKVFDENGILIEEGNGSINLDINDYEEGDIVKTGNWNIYQEGNAKGVRTYKECTSNNYTPGYAYYTEKIEIKDISHSKILNNLEEILSKNNENMKSLTSYEKLSTVKIAKYSLYDTATYFRNGIKVMETINDGVARLHEDGLMKIYYLDGVTPYYEAKSPASSDFDHADHDVFNEFTFYNKYGDITSKAKFGISDNSTFIIDQFNHDSLIQETTFNGERYNVVCYNKGKITSKGSFIPSKEEYSDSPSIKLLKSINHILTNNIKVVKDGTWTYHNPQNIIETFEKGNLLSQESDMLNIKFNSSGHFKSYQKDSILLTPLSMEIISWEKSKKIYSSEIRIIDARVNDIMNRNGNEYFSVDSSFVEALIAKFMHSDISYIWYENEGRVIRKGSMSNGQESGIEIRYDLSMNFEMRIDHNTGTQTFSMMNGSPASGIFTVTDIQNNPIETIEIKNGQRHGTTVIFDNGIEIKKEKYRHGEHK